jgi:hypothetical protein
MSYSLSYNLKKEMGLKYVVPFGKYYRGDIVRDDFENSEEEDAETWVTDFCHWPSQENLRDSWKLKFAMEAMNHTDVFWAKKQKAMGTWENFLHLFRESFMGHCKYWAGTDPSVVVLSSFVGVACNVGKLNWVRLQHCGPVE